jgi:hypothetical protein
MTITKKRCHITLSMEVLEELLQLPLEAEITSALTNYASNSVTFFISGWGPETPEAQVSKEMPHFITQSSSIISEIGT